jgi:hypothetical protein
MAKVNLIRLVKYIRELEAYFKFQLEISISVAKENPTFTTCHNRTKVLFRIAFLMED